VKHSISHVLVIVDPDDESLATPLAAIQLTSGTGALVTLLHVDQRQARVKATAQLDAIANLHEVLLAPPDETIVAPVYSDDSRRQAVERLRVLREKLVAFGPDDLQIRVVCRRGDGVAETLAFVEEAGVDVVFVPAPSICNCPALRRLSSGLRESCPCLLQVVYPAHAHRVQRNSAARRWWNAMLSRWRKPGTLLSASPDRLAPEDVHSAG
jgi:hypothetical protein